MCEHRRLAAAGSFQPHGLQSFRLLCPWNSPGNKTGVSGHSLLQRFFLTQGMNSGLLHCRQILCYLSHQESPLLYMHSSFFSRTYIYLFFQWTSSLSSLVPSYFGETVSLLPGNLKRRKYKWESTAVTLNTWCPEMIWGKRGDRFRDGFGKTLARHILT